MDVHRIIWQLWLSYPKLRLHQHTEYTQLNMFFSELMEARTKLEEVRYEARMGLEKARSNTSNATILPLVAKT